MYIKKCLPLFKEYKPRVKKANRKLMTTVPSYVPAFNESSSVVDYPYENVTWKGLYKTPLRRVNLLNKLKFYSRRSGKDYFKWSIAEFQQFNILFKFKIISF